MVTVSAFHNCGNVRKYLTTGHMIKIQVAAQAATHKFYKFFEI
jgi:hypothetical protein